MEQLNNLPPFYVGQKILCVRTHEWGYCIKNEEYIVKGIMKSCCGYLVDIGATTDLDMNCTYCYAVVETNGIAWLNSNRFVEIQKQKFPLIKYSKVLEKELVCSN